VTDVVCPRPRIACGLKLKPCLQAPYAIVSEQPRHSGLKRICSEATQQELDEVKQRYEQIQEEKDLLDLKNSELLVQYDQAIADRSRVDHELLSVRSENRSLSEERKNLHKRPRDACGKGKEAEQRQKERDKRWHMRCESIKEEWEKANLSLRTELKEMALQRDESRHRLQRCQELEAVLEAFGKVVKREEQEIEIQVLRSREVVEPEFFFLFFFFFVGGKEGNASCTVAP